MTHENTYRDDIPRTLLNKDLLIFVSGPGLQLLLVFIMKSAKNVIVNSVTFVLFIVKHVRIIQMTDHLTAVIERGV
jgi:hypothetical protein